MISTIPLFRGERESKGKVERERGKREKEGGKGKWKQGEGAGEHRRIAAGQQ